MAESLNHLNFRKQAYLDARVRLFFAVDIMQYRAYAFKKDYCTF